MNHAAFDFILSSLPVPDGASRASLSLSLHTVYFLLNKILLLTILNIIKDNFFNQNRTLRIFLFTSSLFSFLIDNFEAEAVYSRYQEIEMRE